MNPDARRILLEGSTPDGVNCLTAPLEFGSGYACEVETGELLYAMARRFKPRLVLQTGTHEGYDVAWIALGLKENAVYYPQLLGFVITIDSGDYNPQNLWDKVGVRNIKAFKGDSTLPETYEGRIPGPLDWIHLDADHSAESIFQEFTCLLPYLNKDKCLISWHDTRLDVRMRPGIKSTIEALETMRTLGKGWKNICHFPLRNLRGVDFLFLSNENDLWEAKEQ